MSLVNFSWEAEAMHSDSLRRQISESLSRKGGVSQNYQFVGKIKAWRRNVFFSNSILQ